MVTPFVEACRKYDVKVGFYYSGMDWFFDREHMNFALGGEKKMNYKGEIVEALPPQPANRGPAIEVFNKRQVEELITQFKPDIWWGDAGHGANLEYIRELHPPIVINNRDGQSGDHATPEGFHMAHPRFIRKPILENVCGGSFVLLFRAALGITTRLRAKRSFRQMRFCGHSLKFAVLAATCLSI